MAPDIAFNEGALERHKYFTGLFVKTKVVIIVGMTNTNKFCNITDILKSLIPIINFDNMNERTPVIMKPSTQRHIRYIILDAVFEVLLFSI